MVPWLFLSEGATLTKGFQLDKFRQIRGGSVQNTEEFFLQQAVQACVISMLGGGGGEYGSLLRKHSPDLPPPYKKSHA